MKFIIVVVVVIIVFGVIIVFVFGVCDSGEVVIKFSYVINIDKYFKGIVVFLLEVCVNEEMNGKVCMEVFLNFIFYDDNKVFEVLL